ncbi:hypothetical protein [Streptomyces sp. NPDC098781]|uniref:hypothetical protein n=1 Tax=Streptomyces sp. NPDC098781 TaxID=3366097 RepID=UPI003813FFE3
MDPTSLDLSGPKPQIPYQPRSVRFQQRVTLGDWVVKLYAIAPHGHSFREGVAEAAVHAARQTLPSPAVTSERYGVGFVIAHDTPQLCYALICWWAEENEVHQQILSAPADRPAELAPHPSHAAGCVWELSVTDFERRAWISYILASPDAPNMAGYLAQEYNDDL